MPTRLLFIFFLCYSLFKIQLLGFFISFCAVSEHGVFVFQHISAKWCKPVGNVAITAEVERCGKEVCFSFHLLQYAKLAKFRMTCNLSSSK